MKKYIFIPVLVIILSCQPTVDYEKDKEAIMAVIQAEGDAFVAEEKERLYDLFIQDDLNVRLGFGGKSYTITKGWDDVKSIYDEYYANSMEGLVSRNSKDNSIVRISKNTAWVICDNIWDWEYQDREGRWSNVEVVFLEKMNSEWKISFMSFLPAPGTQLDKDNLNKARKELLEGLNTNDIDRFMAMLTEDHVTYPPGVEAMDNRENYRVWQEARIKGMENYDVEGDFQLIKTDMYSGIAYDRFVMKVVLTPKTGGESMEIRSQGIWIWKKIGGGQWALAEAIWNDF